MLAYLDTFAGLVPCTVRSVQRIAGRLQIIIRLNATRGAWKRGEILNESPRHVFPRSHVIGRYRRYCGATLIGGYAWSQHIDRGAALRRVRVNRFNHRAIWLARDVACVGALADAIYLADNA